METSPRFRDRVLPGLPALFALVFFAPLVLAAPNAKPIASATAATTGVASPEEEPVDPGSPRASVTAFLEQCRAGQYAEAARVLSLSGGQARRGPELARRLQASLDRHVWLDLDTVSALPGGNLHDGLPANVEEVARIPKTGTAGEPVRLTRRATGDPRWVFSPSTVAHIDSWYDSIPERWLLENLPSPLLRPGPRDLLWWQWLALPVLLFGAWGLGYVLGRLSRGLLVKLAARTASRVDDVLAVRLGGPLTLAWALAVFYLCVPWLALYRPAEQFVRAVIHGALLFAFFWALSRLIDVWGTLLAESQWAKQHSSSQSLVPLVVRVGKIVVLVVAVVAFVSELGYPVASLVAGLGVGGLAVALAAQKTLENLFGAFSIGADQPFRPGDFIRVDDFTGTVETVGLRSTRIRTLDRTLITIPNGKLSEMRVESYAMRDRMRLACNIGVVYDTEVAQMRAVLAGLERTLRAHPKIWPDNLVVRFKEFGDSALIIEVMAWFCTSDWGEFLAIRQEILLEFMQVVAEAGTHFAFPTRTVQVVSGHAALRA
jgi:MscS family membrane protein